jgi:DNA helicase-2/ATP-dependent DNA helicase PcrA
LEEVLEGIKKDKRSTRGAIKIGAPRNQKEKPGRSALGPGSGTAPAQPTLRGKPLKKVSASGGSFEASGDNLKPEELKVGMRVVHGRFGLGTVKNLEGAGADAKAIITFDNAGEKRLLLKFAKVRAV